MVISRVSLKIKWIATAIRRISLSVLFLLRIAAIAGDYNEREMLSSRGGGGISPFFPSLAKPSQPITQERLFQSPLEGNRDRQQHQRLPPISKASTASAVPLTTKYTEYRKARRQNQQARSQRWNSDEDVGGKAGMDAAHKIETLNRARRRRNNRSSSQDRFIISY